MTEQDEEKLKNIVASLVNGYQELQQGMKLMTDVVVRLERRVAELEQENEPKSRIIHPFVGRN